MIELTEYSVDEDGRPCYFKDSGELLKQGDQIQTMFGVGTIEDPPEEMVDDGILFNLWVITLPSGFIPITELVGSVH